MFSSSSSGPSKRRSAACFSGSAVTATSPDSGWRTRSCSCMRSPSTAVTAEVTTSMSRLRSSAIRSARGCGYSQRCTLSGASGSCAATRSRYMYSVRNGMTGARTLQSVTSVS